MNKSVVIIGAGGHAKVIAEIIERSNDKVIGFLDDNIRIGTEILNYKVLGNVDTIENMNKEYYYIIAIGNNDIRKKIYNKFKSIKYYTAIDPSAIVSNSAKIGIGTVIMPNSVINSSSSIGKFCIINTSSIVEHDNYIEDFVHISPTATLSGTVKVHELSHIGTGAKIKNNININKKCVIGVGAIVVKDINEEGVYVGIPANKIKELN